MGGKPLRIIQLSDIHIFSKRDQALLGVKTQESFDAVVALMEAERGQIDAIMLTGDLSQDGSAASYNYIADKLRGFNVPIYAVPGNHDNISMLLQTYVTGPICCEQVVLFKDWELILLNTHKPGAVEGELAANQLQFLKTALAKAAVPNIIVFFHHHPILIGSKWLDNLGLTNKEDFWQIISNDPRIKAIVFGHIHQEYEGYSHQKLCLALPSTCIQFKPMHDEFALDNKPPGYRWLNLYPDGKIETGVKRATKYVGEFQADAKGY